MSAPQNWEAIILPRMVRQQQPNEFDCTDDFKNTFSPQRRSNKYYIGVLRGVLPHIGSNNQFQGLYYTGNLCHRTFVLLQPSTQQPNVKIDLRKEILPLDIYLEISQDTQSQNRYKVEYAEIKHIPTTFYFPLLQIKILDSSTIDVAKIFECKINWEEVKNASSISFVNEGRLPKVIGFITV